MFYSEDVIEQVRSASDIVDVISGYVKLKKSGSSYTGLCPFHNEKTPSFSVNPTRQMFKCFGCGISGNVFTFVMKYENYEFPEAIEQLARRASIELPKGELSEQKKREISLKNRMLEANREAAKYYYMALRSPEGAAGLAYFKGRGLSDETIKSFGLGFAPQNSQLVAYLKSKGFDNEVIREAALGSSNEKNGMSDRFWNRVMFPIMDTNNKVIAFGGRVMGDGKPKYLNSPETKIFNKSESLYGINRARSTKSDYFIVCEGYMDVISLHQAGFTQAVAALGTAFTYGHAREIKKKYKKDNLRLIFDSDNAGINAALRAIPICRQAGITARIVDLKPYKDPDEFIKGLGAEEFEKRLAAAENGLYFEMRMDERGFDMSDPDDRTKFLKKAAERLSRIEDEMERSSYIAAVASKYMVKEELLEGQVSKAAARNEGIESFERPRSGMSRNKAKEDGGYKAQRLFISSLVENPQIYSQIKEYLEPEDFDDGISRRTVQLLYEQLERNGFNPAAIISQFEELEEQNQVTEMLTSRLGAVETVSEREKYISELVIKIKKASIERQMRLPGSTGNSLEQMRENRKRIENLRQIRIVL